MKVLLIDPSADPGPTTLLVFPGRPEGELKTLAGEPAERGFVAESDWPTVNDSIFRTPDVARTDRDTYPVERAIREEVTWMARWCLALEAGSVIGVNYEQEDLFVLDTSKAKVVDAVPDLVEGDRVVIAAPAHAELVNARGRATSIRMDRVMVRLDPGDRTRLGRSAVDPRYPAAVFVPRSWLERAAGRRWRRRLDRVIWRLRCPGIRSARRLP
jgi:hypothetical protein